MRRVINDILYINRSANARRMMPRDFGPWSSVYHDFRMFRDDDTWQWLHDKLRERVRRKAGKKPTPSRGRSTARASRLLRPEKEAPRIRREQENPWPQAFSDRLPRNVS